MPHSVGDLAEVLDNLGVFSMHPEEVLALCPSGFRRVPITSGDEFYLSLQGFTAHQPAYAHTHPDSEEWVVVLEGSGKALLADNPVPLEGSLGDRAGDRAPPRLREWRRADDAPIDPAPASVGAGDDVGPAGRDDGSDRLRVRRDVPPLSPLRRAQPEPSSHALRLRELHARILSYRPELDRSSASRARFASCFRSARFT